MVKYTFKLKKNIRPDLAQKGDNKKVYAGIYLVYNIYKSFYVTLFKKQLCYFRYKIATKTFLRPLKKFWDKRTYRLPYVYWGKKSHPFTRHWVIVPNDSFSTNKIVPELSFIHQHVKLFGRNFKSKDITLQLFGNENKFNLLSIN